MKNIDINIVYGRHPVMEALKSSPIDKIYAKKGINPDFYFKVKKIAAKKSIIFTDVDEATFIRLCGKVNHQGIAAVLSMRKYDTLEDILKVSQEKNTDPFILILNEVQDPQNLGSLIRSAVAVGIDGIVIPKRRAARLSPTVSKVSAGNDSKIKVALVTNISDTLISLKEKNILVVGAEGTAEVSLFDYNFKGPIALVLGGESKGLGQRVKNTCDILISIPLIGPAESLNVGVAGGIFMYSILKDRIKNKF